MRLNLDMNILRQMTDGVVVLDRYAQIVAFNKIAEPWAPRCQAISAALKRLIDEELSGRLVLPLYIELQTDRHSTDHQRADAWLCKNGRSEYAVFIVSHGPAAAADGTTSKPKRGQRNLLALVGNDVREQLSILRALIQPSGSQLPLAPAAIEQQCKKVEQLMQEVTDLSQLLEHDEVFAGERLSLADLIENILVSLPPNASQATIELHTGTDTLGPVYGNGAWLSYALRLLISCLIAGAPRRAVIQLATQQKGNFLTLRGHISETRNGRTATVRPHPAPVNAEPVDENASSIQMMMCKRIIELHAGQLQLTSPPTDKNTLQSPSKIESFTLTLMTSMPAHERSHASCADCRHVGQALSFASDMARLIASTQTTISDRSLQP